MSRNIDEYSYIHGLSTACFIYTHGGQRGIFYTTAEPYRKTIIFPPQCIVCSSEMGLVLLRRHTKAVAVAGVGADANANTMYLVSNPSYSGSERSIPNPPRPHPNPTPRVLVVGWDSARPCLVFHIVCAVHLANTFSYSFDVYSSNTDTWESAWMKQVINLGRTIRENTGVSCGTRAYWLLDGKVPTVAYYDVTSGIVGTILPPEECARCPLPFLPQLGRWGCRLCLVVALDRLKSICIFTLGQDGKWLRYLHQPYGGALPPTLSRFQSAKLQVPLWCELGNDNRLVFLENGWYGGSNFRAHSWPKLDSPEPNSIHDVLPHVATHWLPLLHFPKVP